MLPRSLRATLAFVFAIVTTSAVALGQSQDQPEDGTGDPDAQDEKNKDKPTGCGGDETAGDPVEISTGAFAFQRKLFEFAGREEPLSISLSYVSNAQGIETQTGARWTHDFEERIVIQYTLLNPIEPYPGPGDVLIWYHQHGEDLGSGPPWQIPLRPLRIDVYHFHDLRVDYYQMKSGDPTTWLPTSGQATKLRSQNVPSGPYSLPRSFILRRADGSKTYFPEALYEGGCGRYTVRAGISEDSHGNQITRAYESVPKPSGCPGGEGQFYRRLSSVTDNYGRMIEFGYDTAGWLDEVTDFTGRKAVIEHDAIGNVTAIELPTVTTLPPLPGISGYTSRTELEYTPLIPGYPESKHNVSHVYAPTEVLAGGASKVPYVVNTWDPTGTRVTSQMTGGTNASGIPAGGKHVFLLETNQVSYGWFTCARRALVVDPDGRVELHLFDSAFRPRLVYTFSGYLDPDVADGMSIDSLVSVLPQSPSVGDSLASAYALPASGSSDPPAGCQWVRRDYHPVTNLLTDETTQDTHTQFVYDSASPDEFQRRNVLIVRRIANDGSGAALQQAYLYEPLYNQVRRAYDPRAFGYTPSNGGTFTPERYSTSISFDYQEDVQTPLQSEINYWGIDVGQSSALGVLSGAGLNVAPIAFGTDLNGNGVIDGHGGKVVRVDRTVRVLASPTATPPTFRTLTETALYEYNSFGLLTHASDPAGYLKEYAYYAVGGGISPDTDPSSATLGGFLATETAFADAAKAQPSTSTFGYDAAGRVNLARDARGNDVEMTSDELDRVVVTTDAAGTMSGRWYDANGNATHEFTDLRTPLMDPATGEPSGALSSSRKIVNTMTYDLLDQLVTRRVQNDAQGGQSVIKYRYTKAGSRVLTLYPEWTTGSGNVESSFFDEFGRTWATTRGGITSQFAAHPSTAAIPERSGIPVDIAGVTATSRAFYDGSKRVRREDEEGHATRFEFDAYNRLVKVIDALGNYTLGTLDVADREVVTERHQATPAALLARTSTLFDERGQPFEVRRDHFDATGAAIGDAFAITRRVFDLRGLATTVVDDNSAVTTYEYDGLRRQTRYTDAAGNSSVSRYDSNGNLIYSEVAEVESDAPAVVRLVRGWAFHDALNRVTTRVDELGHARRYLYDSFGRLVFESDARAALVDVPLASLDSPTNPQHGDLSSGPLVNRHGNTTWHEYDDQGYLLETLRHRRVNGLGGNAFHPVSNAIVCKRGHDLNGRLTVETDDAGNETHHDYDALDRVVATHYANQEVATRQYYRNGLTKQTVDPNGTVVDFQYDLANRLRWHLVTPGAGVKGELFAEFQHDGADRMTLARNAGSTVVREYDSLSQLSAETLDGKRTELRHDGAGHLTGYTYPSGRVLDNVVDSIGRLRSVSDHGDPTPVARFEYRSETAYKTQTFKNGVVGTTLYDALFRATGRTYVSGAATLENRTFSWDRQSSKATRSDQLTSARTWTYTYDSTARMVKSVRTGGGQPGTTITYNLDDLANRKTVVGGPQAGTYTMNASDLPMNAYTTTPFDQRTYDDNGNLESTSTSLAISYDYGNRMVEYEDSATGRHHYYFYDALGRRIRKRTDAGAPSEKTVRFYYDGGLRICEERDAAGAVVATYVNGSGIDEVLSMRRDVNGDGTAEHYYYHADDLGNVLTISNASGSAAEKYEYRDYGQVVNVSALAPLTSSAVLNSRLFTGRELDWETGLYYYRARYYDPLAGRFVSRDPLGVWGDTGNVGNAQTYAASNPWTFVDPLGLEGGCALPADQGASNNDPKGVKGDCRTSTSDPEGVKGDTKSHGSVTGKKGKSGERLSDKEYQEQRQERIAKEKDERARFAQLMKENKVDGVPANNLCGNVELSTGYNELSNPGEPDSERVTEMIQTLEDILCGNGFTDSELKEAYNELTGGDPNSGYTYLDFLRDTADSNPLPNPPASEQGKDTSPTEVGGSTPPNTGKPLSPDQIKGMFSAGTLNVKFPNLITFENAKGMILGGEASKYDQAAIEKAFKQGQEFGKALETLERVDGWLKLLPRPKK